MIKLFFPVCLMLGSILLSSPLSYAQSTDCDTAAASCKAQCKSAKILNKFTRWEIVTSDYQGQCEKSCQAGFKSCQTQDTKASCETFDYHCASACPWSVFDFNANASVESSNSFAACAHSCFVGREDCRKIVKTIPPRSRTGKFDPCEEAQFACYSDCANGPDAEMDECAKACFQGQTACKADTSPQKCKVFDKGCADFCPPLNQANDMGNFLGDEFQGQSSCDYSCGEGSDYCEEILGK